MKRLPLGLGVLLLTSAAAANSRIAVLDFELNDITSLPNTPAERQRTATMAPLLIEALSSVGEYQTLAVPGELQKTANASFGYLFSHPEESVGIGRQMHADWLLVSQHSKPSYLFSYLWVYLVDVQAGKPIARYDIELKGSHAKVTEHAIAALAAKIGASLHGAQTAVRRMP